MTSMWAFFGHDEPNYTYMHDGQKLLSELASLSPVPVHVRVHNLLTTGDGMPRSNGDRPTRTRKTPVDVLSTTGRSSIASSTPTWNAR